jgi:hypothetical protein
MVTASRCGWGAGAILGREVARDTDDHVMNRIAFVFVESPGSGDHQVRPIVDGADLLNSIASDWLGLDPPAFFGQPQLVSGGRLFIGRCECGYVECDWVAARVVRDERSVTWQLDDGRKYEFDSTEYLGTIECAADNTEWEPVERTAERLVSCLDFRNIERQGYTFEWASARISPGRIILSFWTVNAPHQQLCEIEWDGKRPEDAAERVKRWVQGKASTLGGPRTVGG